MKKIILSREDLDGVIAQVSNANGSMTFQCDLWGTSMLPLIHPGDRITVQTVSLEQMASQEVVLYRDENQCLVAHKLLYTEHREEALVAFIQAMDPASKITMVNQESIVGRVIHIESPRWLQRLVRRVLQKRSRLLQRGI